MPRNLDHRVEVLFPLVDSKLIARIHDGVLRPYLSDSVKARRMLPDGTYERKKSAGSGRPINSQEALIARRKSSDDFVKPGFVKSQA
jgi:polyphosphate kinase